jgi:hypothetical protein
MYDAYNDQINWRQYAQGVSRQFADLIDSMIQRKASQRPANTQVILQRLNQLNGNRSQSNNQVIQGEDIEVELNVSQQEASSGTSKSVSFPRYIYVNGKRQSETKTLTVQVPAGSQNRTRLRLQGQGNQGLNGGNSGNVYVSLLVANNQPIHDSVPGKSNKWWLMTGGLIGIAVLGFILFPKQDQGFNQGGSQTETSSSICFIARPTKGPKVKIRSDANQKAKVETNIPDGTKVSYLNEQQGAFFKVKLSDGSEGWVYNDQVQRCDSPQGSNNSQGFSQPVNNNPAPSNPQATSTTSPTPTPTNTEIPSNIPPEIEKARDECQNNGGTWRSVAGKCQYDQNTPNDSQNPDPTYAEANYGGDLEACINDVKQWGAFGGDEGSARSHCLTPLSQIQPE